MVQLWAKIKSQYDTASTALSNLTISSSDEDGPTESDTVIHNGLVKYYINKGQSPPSWLGVEETDQFSMTQQYSRSNMTDQPGVRRMNTQSSSLQDIYNRHQRPAMTSNSSGPATQSEPSMRFRPPPRAQSFDQKTQEDNRSDKFRNKLRSTRAQW